MSGWLTTARKKPNRHHKANLRANEPLTGRWAAVALPVAPAQKGKETSMDDYITRPEHDEFAKRMEEEHHRQNRRIGELEETVQQIGKLTVSVEKMAMSMEQMVKEQKDQGERLGKLEDVPAKNWNTVKVAILTAIGTAIGTGIVAAVINYIGG